MDRKTLAIAVSTPSVSLRWLQAWTETILKLAEHFNLSIHLNYSTIVCVARVSNAKEVLNVACDYVVMLDGDNPPAPAQIVQLIADLQMNPEIDLAAGWYRLDLGDGNTSLSCGRSLKVPLNTYPGPRFQRRYPADEADFLSPEAPDLQEIDWTGLGCVVMRKSLLETCGAHAFLPEQEGPEEYWSGHSQGFIWDDMHFCKVARAAGKRLFVDRRVRVPHLKLRDITLPAGEAAKEPAEASAGTDE